MYIRDIKDIVPYIKLLIKIYTTVGIIQRVIELYQFDDDKKTINYYRLIEKMSKMKYLRFSYFRPLIFECMNLIDKIGD